jgi:hypothetical protein
MINKSALEMQQYQSHSQTKSADTMDFYLHKILNKKLNKTTVHFELIPLLTCPRVIFYALSNGDILIERSVVVFNKN